MVKITQESIGDVVLPTQEPLGVFLDAHIEEEGGMMTRRIDADCRLHPICVLPDDFPEVGLAEPSCGRGAVHHQKGTVAAVQTASQHIDPWNYDQRDAL
jgi:hypothetical protein